MPKRKFPEFREPTKYWQFMPDDGGEIRTLNLFGVVNTIMNLRDNKQSTVRNLERVIFEKHYEPVEIATIGLFRRVS